MSAARKKTRNVDELRKARDVAQLEFDRAGEALRVARGIADPHVFQEVGSRAGEPKGTSRADYLRSRAKLPALHAALDVAAAELEDAEVAYRAAREEQRATDRKAALERLRPKLPELDAALANVAEILGKLMPDDLASGEHIVDGFGILLDDPQQPRDGLITTWRQRCEDMGVL